ncbi:MAG: biotin synthase BioB [Candidatus Omnitrophota bacterium]|nr:MAG: biotin synthase BioB [Candidatus Omnitrophota bacterium]
MSLQNKIWNKIGIVKLIALANKQRERRAGNSLYTCAIINAKSLPCSEDCKFCVFSKSSTAQVSLYPLKSKEEIKEKAEISQRMGAMRFSIVITGRKASRKEIEKICEAIQYIKREVKGIRLCASLGVVDRSELLLLKQAGLDRYHCNLETSERFFPYICRTHTFADKLRTIEWAKEVGLEVCSGILMGMGEREDDRIEVARTLNRLQVHGIPFNVLLPRQGTPLASLSPVSLAEVLKTVSIFRLICKDKQLILACRSTIKPELLPLLFMAGMNGLMIGDLLTIKGNPEQDRSLLERIEQIWKEETEEEKVFSLTRFLPSEQVVVA